MNPETRAIAEAARELMAQGDVTGAERVLTPVFQDLQSEAPVLHLMGLIKKAQKRWEDAERYLRAAIVGALSEGSYYNDLAVVLQARRNYAEAEHFFRAAAVMMPHAVAVRINLIRCIMATGDLARAEVETKQFTAMQPCAESWALLGQVYAGQRRFEDAVAAAEQALTFAPRLRLLRHNLAIAYDAAGRKKESLALLEELAAEGVDSPEFAVNYSRALHLAERKDEAEAVLEQALRQWGDAPAVHSALARMRWMRGLGAESTLYLEAALKQFPKDLALRLTCADMLHRGGFHEKAGLLLQEGLALAPNDPALLSSMGVVLDESNRVPEALAYLRRAAQLTPGQARTHRNLVPTMLRAKEPEEALRLIRALRETAPEDQELIAYEATALRMLGDPAYRVLYDYERLVNTYDIPPPRGFFSAKAFNESLAESVRALHRAEAHPLDLSLRNGSQTGRSLLDSEDVNIKAFLSAIDAAVRHYIGELLPHPQDPVGRRKGRDHRLINCWSVLLRDGGFHVNHVHQEGWISSAYYVDLPPGLEEAPDKAGCIKFGEPRLETPGCTPEKFVVPRVGRLVLFPSYMWHGTVPFRGGERLSIAFDVAPV